MENNKVFAVLKNWSYAVGKDNKIRDYRAVFGTVTKQTEKALTFCDKLVVPTDSILTFEFIETAELPKEWEISTWDNEKFNKIKGDSPIYEIE